MTEFSNITYNLANLDLQETKFRDKFNRRKTQSLFIDNRPYGPNALYTLQDEDKVVDGKSYPSLRRLYLEQEDLTEYTFALKYFESWEHWQMLLQNKWFDTYISRWRTELELKLKAEALQALLNESRDGGKNSYNALRFIIDKGWVDKTTEPSRRGRPSKAEISAQAQEVVLSDKQILEDFKRLELSPSPTNKEIN